MTESGKACWTIDVCATCGRLAVWPFCTHRDSGRGWTRAVVVEPIRKQDKLYWQALQSGESKDA